jgi:hypothetical protein
MPTNSINDSAYGGYAIFLQSKDAKEISNNNSFCNFYLDKIIKPDRNDIGMLISVIDAEIPYSWYNISESIGNNKITINAIEYEFDSQNYSAYNIVDALTEKFTIAVQDIVIDFDDNANRFTLSSPNPITINSTTMEKELPFTANPLISQTKFISGVCNLSGTANIYLKSDNMLIENVNSFGKTNGVLSKILVNTSPSSFVFHNPSNIQYYKLHNDLHYINLQMINDDGEFIDFKISIGV